MQRLEIYLSDTNRLVIGVFDPVDSEYEKYTLRGQEAYRYLRKLAKSKILDIAEEPKYNEMTLVYKNYIVNLNEYETLLNRKIMAPIIDEIKDYIQKQKLNKVKGKKVKRKNKYTGKRIAAATLTILIVSTCAMGLAKAKKTDIETPNNVGYEQLYEEEYDEKIVEEQSTENNENLKLDSVVEKEKTTVEDNVTKVSINYDDRSNTTKAYVTQSYYGNMITKYARMYGIDPALAIAVATQERGIHSSVKDEGGATGLMQIQNSVWIGQNLSAYNFETQKNESRTITLSDVQNVETNIKIGCMILQNNFQYMKYNTLAAIQSYNMGYGNMMKILNRYALDTNRTVDEILSATNDNGWLDYRKIITCGD